MLRVDGGERLLHVFLEELEVEESPPVAPPPLATCWGSHPRPTWLLACIFPADQTASPRAPMFTPSPHWMYTGIVRCSRPAQLRRRTARKRSPLSGLRLPVKQPPTHSGDPPFPTP